MRPSGIGKNVSLCTYTFSWPRGHHSLHCVSQTHLSILVAKESCPFYWVSFALEENDGDPEGENSVDKSTQQKLMENTRAIGNSTMTDLWKR